ncbi:VIT1/CCC1 transporter family protein [Lutimaribacter sp. EGI FJ00015]|uniref:VIT1/CCC1 transporter family protein n=1 Tax=Lutimaribacter degradans TaxID=2945989 RepID=A0ACC5ZSB3_9RHOB|nr:VIT1/CCC1 transporter family protein [Lutimaribacter sp. EGI FJ00013]MCM2561202.1 VIT1/CCC1 transporter family protein [Lutimaribacter sp. EGI FJ00013]MCO0611849.1 VIT1/CCC1 transporter family protein [Lutimaribacter sp. EGI FJ00015]MCO0635030.1 VIT1/CCC1 transporter family protein [Lutimaribacter sp. EGI FJ00014]
MDWQSHRRDAHKLGRTQEFLKQIVYGGNDGIVTTFAIVAGFAGAAADGVAQIGGLAVLVFGLANLFADAVSMGLGEFLSARSQGDLYRSRRDSELSEIARNPEQERTELFEILRQRGLSPGEADSTAQVLARHPDFMADLMMTYEFGMSDPDEESPALNGLFTFGSFVIFGAVPLVPYFLFDPTDRTFVLSVLSTGMALVALGLLRWNATGERVTRCVGETVLVGTICAVVAFAVGWIVGG